MIATSKAGIDLLTAFRNSPDLRLVEIAPDIFAVGLVSKPTCYPNLIDSPADTDPIADYDAAWADPD